jgi:hypothetical protein
MRIFSKSAPKRVFCVARSRSLKSYLMKHKKRLTIYKFSFKEMINRPENEEKNKDYHPFQQSMEPPPPSVNTTIMAIPFPL